MDKIKSYIEKVNNNHYLILILINFKVARY